MQVDTAAALYTLLTERGVRLWVLGGWGVDALLGQQTRPHKDLDVFVSLGDLDTLIGALAALEWTLKLIWEENRWMPHPVQLPLIGRAAQGNVEVATAFVVRNGVGHELDVHVLRIDSTGTGIPAWNAEGVFPPESLAGHGMLAGAPVRCLSAQMQMNTHTGYALLPKDLQDVRLLHERYDVEYTPEQAQHFTL